MKINPNFKARTAPPGQKHSRPNPVKIEEYPWTRMFIDKGYKSAAIPRVPPPENGTYGEILSWVTGDGWELEGDVELAISIWRGDIDPLNYISIPKQNEAETAKVVSRPENQAPSNDIGDFLTSLM